MTGDIGAQGHLDQKDLEDGSSLTLALTRVALERHSFISACRHKSGIHSPSKDLLVRLEELVWQSHTTREIAPHNTILRDFGHRRELLDVGDDKCDGCRIRVTTCE